jgi:transcriptional regulator with XRE-family HTH domain
MNKTIGLKIKKIRIENDLSQDEFSNIIGISKEDLSNFENNVTDIPVDILREIVEIFNIDANWLLTEKETMPQNKQKIGNISNSTVIGANVSGNDISIQQCKTTCAELIIENFRTLIEMNKKIQEQNDNIIELVSKLIDGTKNRNKQRKK